MKLIVDLMGGDNAPTVVIKGIELALKLGFVQPDEITMVGTDEALDSARRIKSLRQLEYIICKDAIGMGEKVPVTTVKRKKDSSIVVGLHRLRDNNSDGLVSAGNSAALTFLATFMLGRVAHGLFPAIAVPMPNIFGQCLLLDIGANAHATAKNLLQNAQMGAIYAKNCMGKENPKIGLINIGEEVDKGNKTVHDAYDLLVKSGLNFIGFIEGRDIFMGKVDVAITDGFTGNTILKSNEGLVKLLDGAIRAEFKKHYLSYFSFLAYPFILPMKKALKKRFFDEETGGAILLGVNKPVIFAHGNSQPLAIANAIRQAKIEVEAGIVNEIKRGINN
ncbi:MAG: phosphate acyltransferase PlsX [Candidatus Buchananbacteria bacterium]|jgi:glycerol-3-phosphate acyltransferase PlsX